MSVQLTLDFFFTFQRAEFALKGAKFLQNTTDGSPALASWKKFAGTEEVRMALENPQDDALMAAIDYYFAAPPRVQIVRNGALDWDDRTVGKRKDAATLLDHVRTTRNNLFHGGKRSPELMRPRDVLLVEHGIVIVRASINAYAPVLQIFESYDMPAQ